MIRPSSWAVILAKFASRIQLRPIIRMKLPWKFSFVYTFVDAGIRSVTRLGTAFGVGPKGTFRDPISIVRRMMPCLLLAGTD